MKSAVDRIEIESDQPAAAPADVAVPEALEEPLDWKRPTSGTREFDDIPSVVRALLTGYDEV